MIIFVIAALAAGLVYWFQFSLETDYDLQSMVFSAHRRGTAAEMSAGKLPIKTGAHAAPLAN